MVLLCFTLLLYISLSVNYLFPPLLSQSKVGNYKSHSGSVDQLCWHPTKPEVLVTASGDKTVRVWDARSEYI